MKKIICAAAVSLIIASTVNAETLITTGAGGGNYFKTGINLAMLMGDGTKAIASKGSVENIERLLSGQAQIGFVQPDALAWYIGKHPEAQQKLEVLGPLYEECVFVAVNKSDESKIRNEDDLQSNKGAIAVGPKGSGSAVTWDYMTRLEPGYGKAKIQYTGGVRTIARLATSLGEDINAYLFTSKADPGNKNISTITNNKNLELIDVDDSDLNDKFPMTGKPVYYFKSVPVTNGLFKTKVKTICMEALVIAASDTDEAVLEEAADHLMNHRASVLGN